MRAWAQQALDRAREKSYLIVIRCQLMRLLIICFVVFALYLTINDRFVGAIALLLIWWFVFVCSLSSPKWINAGKKGVNLFISVSTGKFIIPHSPRWANSAFTVNSSYRQVVRHHVCHRISTQLKDEEPRFTEIMMMISFDWCEIVRWCVRLGAAKQWRNYVPNNEMVA